MGRVFLFFVCGSIVIAFAASLLSGEDRLSLLSAAMFSSAELAVEISLGLVGVLALWSGLFRLAEQSGLADTIGRSAAPLLGRLMPGLSKTSASGPVTLNLSANLLGLDNAATPLGLKAMDALQQANADKQTATNAQIMFLVLNTSSVTLIPVTVFLYRAQQGAASPADIYLPLLMATTASTFFGVWLTARVQRVSLLNPVVMAFAVGWLVLLAGIASVIIRLPQEAANQASAMIGNGLLLLVVMAFLLSAWRRSVPVYDCFIEGAKEGFDQAVRLIPYLVAMLVAIGMLRACGALDAMLDGVKWCALLLGMDTRWVDALPVALMKPFSGSGARAAMLDVMQVHGVDSLAGRMAAVMQGSTETTFYVLAVYFGSAGITRFRHALWCGLAADMAGMVTAIGVTYLFFA